MSVESAITPYPEHWKLTTLGQLCSDGGGTIQTGPFGSQLHASDYVEFGIPSIMPKNISIEGISTEDIARITTDDANRLAKYLVKEGDIVYSRRGDVEKCSLISEKESGWLCGTGCLKVSLGDYSSVPSSYIHAYLSHPAIREWISRRAVGATMPNLNTSILSEVPILVPPENEINFIRNVWMNTTSKMNLNRQTNQTLEEMAQAVFKSWFVDFDPTRAKIKAKENGEDPTRAAMAALAGKTTEHLDTLAPEQLQTLSTAAALFPDAMEDSELGEIPQGWAIKLTGDVLDVRDGTHDSPKKSEIGYPLVTSKHITSGVLKIEDAYLISDEDFRKINKRSRVEQYDILLTMIGTVGVSYFVLQPEVNFAIKNIGLFRTSEVEQLRNYFYLLLKSPKMKAYLEARMAGTTQKYLSLKTLRSIEMLAPSKELLAAFNDLVNPLMDKIFISCSEADKLASLRDTLLPKLLSGELTTEVVKGG
ncbi:restriction endonuclease subunit S [Pseudovibrio sp. Alg231-02]|uniref:restriction endonuclease subunit S n=1 Tax=Pseudovibrio sp. Alg231-02 TaxID=1922223 RepID=UPI000D55517A|nr:restriction endonuclease subunit S [Pseudovibrio sp. Alg231-02]